MILQAIVDYHWKPFFSRTAKSAAKKPANYILILVFIGYFVFTFYRSILKDQIVTANAANAAYVLAGYLIYALLTGRYENRFDGSEAMPFFTMPVRIGDGVTLIVLAKLFRQTFQTLIFCALAVPVLYRSCGSWALSAGTGVLLFPFVWANEYLVVTARLFRKTSGWRTFLLALAVLAEFGICAACIFVPKLTIPAEVFCTAAAVVLSQVLLNSAAEAEVKTGFFSLPDSFKKRRGGIASAFRKVVDPYFYELVMTETASKKSRFSMIYGFCAGLFAVGMVLLLKSPLASQFPANGDVMLSGIFIFDALTFSAMIENRDYSVRSRLMKSLSVPFGKFFAMEGAAFVVQFLVFNLVPLVAAAWYKPAAALCSVGDFVFVPLASLCFRFIFKETSLAESITYILFAVAYGFLKIAFYQSGLWWLVYPAGAAVVAVLYPFAAKRYAANEQTL